MDMKTRTSKSFFHTDFTIIPAVEPQNFSAPAKIARVFTNPTFAKAFQENRHSLTHSSTGTDRSFKSNAFPKMANKRCNSC